MVLFGEQKSVGTEVNKKYRGIEKGRYSIFVLYILHNLVGSLRRTIRGELPFDIQELKGLEIVITWSSMVLKHCLYGT